MNCGIFPPVLQKTYSAFRTCNRVFQYGGNQFTDTAFKWEYLDLIRLPRFFAGEKYIYKQFIINRIKITLMDFMLKELVAVENQELSLNDNTAPDSRFRIILKHSAADAVHINLDTTHSDQVKCYLLRRNLRKSFYCYPKSEIRCSTDNADTESDLLKKPLSDILHVMGHARGMPICIQIGVALSGDEPVKSSTLALQRLLSCRAKIQVTYTLSDRKNDLGEFKDS